MNLASLVKACCSAAALLALVACGGGGDASSDSESALARPSAPPTLTTLKPGDFREIDQNLKVNVVFVGFDTAATTTIDTAALRSRLPGGYRSIHRYPDFYGIRQPTGNRFAFDYNVVKTDSAYADRLFGQLSSLAVAQPRTLFQNLYNQQAGALDVGQNHAIDAPSVEAWLAANPPTGVNASDYTVYFINWHGRPDFKFHVYTKVNEPDPDTGFNFGANRGSRRMVAWGGTPAASGAAAKRVWFYDFSAGPEFWNGNFDITSADVDGDGQADYRIPPIWDYGNANGYRAFNDLTRDAALLTRFVAINLLFTTSPLYKPAISPPKLPSTINVDLTMYQGDPTTDGTLWLKPDLVRQSLSGLQRHNTFTTDLTSAPFDQQIASTYTCFFTNQSCFGNRLFGIGFGDLFLYHNSHLTQYLEGDADYEVPVFNFSVPDQLSSGLLGFADDNWADGTQSYVFNFMSPGIRAAGYGLTTTTIHEVGHHLGMSHPHDGYDSELDVDYGASGSLYFANSGDESHTVMSYIDLTKSFGQFDRDNMDRWKTAAYINHANTILALIYKSPRAGSVSATLVDADALAAQALADYGSMNYATAVLNAKAAYTRVLNAAATINVPVEPQAWTADYKAKGRSGKFVDTLDYRRMAP